ncbi:lipase member I-like [Hermetia illucens]|uniref:lipase member I-like n=1 Tax=Hermetia illucens TaxID=343691 RepID=UPI0018CC39E2|nr:lipase member I-like [Hermetia illucens]
MEKDTNPNIYELPKATSILEHPKFDKGKPTVIYIHGFLGKLSADDVKAVVAAYAARNDHNILVLDWHSQAVPGYFLHAVKNVYKVGAQAAGAILDMIDKGLNVKHLHIVGHSLGGQMAGVIGRTVYKESNETIKLPRLSALDPAYPGFYGYTNAAHLSRDDAELVDVLHTDSGVYGAPMSTGTVDFWPNNKNDQQPGCFVK